MQGESGRVSGRGLERSLEGFTHKVRAMSQNSASPVIANGCADASRTIDQSRLQRELPSILEADASIRNEASRRYLDQAVNPFCWSDSD